MGDGRGESESVEGRGASASARCTESEEGREGAKRIRVIRHRRIVQQRARGSNSNGPALSCSSSYGPARSCIITLSFLFSFSFSSPLSCSYILILFARLGGGGLGARRPPSTRLREHCSHCAAPELKASHRHRHHFPFRRPCHCCGLRREIRAHRHHRRISIPHRPGHRRRTSHRPIFCCA